MGNADPVTTTVATANLLPLGAQEVRDNQYRGMGLMGSGKSSRLERELHGLGVDILGVQESRIQGSVDVRREHYRMLCTFATPEGAGWCATVARPNILAATSQR